MHNEGVFKVRKTSYVLGRKEAKASFSDALCALGSLYEDEEQLDWFSGIHSCYALVSGASDEAAFKTL